MARSHSQEETLFKLSPEQLDTKKRLLDREIEMLREERQKLVARKKRFDEAIDRAIKNRENRMVELTGSSELIRLMLNDEVPFESGPVDGTEGVVADDWTESDDERLLLPIHLGGIVRQVDEYTVPPELTPDDDYLMASVLPY